MKPSMLSDRVAFLEATVAKQAQQIAALCQLVSGLPADMPETIPLATYQSTKTQRLMREARKFAVTNGLSVEELRGPSHQHEIAHPRQDLMDALHKQGFSTTDIGKFLGGRDHTTISYGIKRAKARKAEAEK